MVQLVYLLLLLVSVIAAVILVAKRGDVSLLNLSTIVVIAISIFSNILILRDSFRCVKGFLNNGHLVGNPISCACYTCFGVLHQTSNVAHHLLLLRFTQGMPSLHCTKPKPIAKLLIGWTVNGPVSFQRVVEL